MGQPRGILAGVWTAFAVLFVSCGSPPLPIGPSHNAQTLTPGPVTSKFGAPLITEGDFSFEANRRPWSGYWYPLSRIDARSALEKYDRLSGRHALAWEEERIRGDVRPFLPWEGRCDAWAFASILRDEPHSPRIVEHEGLRETFSIAEQKALWIFSHEQLDATDREVFGERNDGDGSSSFEDLLPAEFHRILQVMLGDRRQPFIMDRDPRPAIWNTPVYGASWRIRRDEIDPELFHVHAWIRTVFPYDSDIDGTDRIAPIIEYTYDLWVSSQDQRVFQSKWTGVSRSSHPDFVTLPRLEADSARSLNPEIETVWLERFLGNASASWSRHAP